MSSYLYLIEIFKVGLILTFTSFLKDGLDNIVTELIEHNISEDMRIIAKVLEEILLAINLSISYCAFNNI
jgi:hypothetical protein